MRFNISCDIEDISGIVYGDHINSSCGGGYLRARRLMIQEVNAAAEGYLAADIFCGLSTAV